MRKKLATAIKSSKGRKPASNGNAKTEDASVADILKLVESCLEDSKAEDTVIIDIRDKSALGDHMVVASGRSQRHVGAIADQLLRALKSAGVKAPRVEGLQHSDWVLIDVGDVIVHLFRPEVREFYGLERMWQMPTTESETTQ